GRRAGASRPALPELSTESLGRTRRAAGYARSPRGEAPERMDGSAVEIGGVGRGRLGSSGGGVSARCDLPSPRRRSPAVNRPAMLTIADLSHSQQIAGIVLTTETAGAVAPPWRPAGFPGNPRE